jgi:hypothetical protein
VKTALTLLLTLSLAFLASFTMTMGEEVAIDGPRTIDADTAYIIARPFMVMTKFEREEYFKVAMARMKEKKINLEDVYFQINTSTGGPEGLLFHSIMDIDAARFLVAYFKYREGKIGQSILPYILNAQIEHFVIPTWPRQTLLDYLTYRSSSEALSDFTRKAYSELMAFYRSEGARLSSELTLGK